MVDCAGFDGSFQQKLCFTAYYFRSLQKYSRQTSLWLWVRFSTFIIFHEMSMTYTGTRLLGQAFLYRDKLKNSISTAVRPSAKILNLDSYRN